MTFQDANLTVTRAQTRVQALFGGHLLADSGDVLIVRQADQEPTFYFPITDIEMAVLQANDHRSDSPGLGEARFYTIMRDARIVENVAWAFDRPVAGRSDIGGRLAFAPEYVEFRVTEIPADVYGEPASFIDETVRHTDSGAGFSQEESWEPTVSEPKTLDPDRPYQGTGSI